MTPQYTPKGLKINIYSDTATSVFIAAQLTIAKPWNQPRCTSIDKWLKKMWYIYTMEYSIKKKNEIIAFASKWMELETSS